jgi:hypothetical protein
MSSASETPRAGGESRAICGRPGAARCARRVDSFGYTRRRHNPLELASGEVLFTPDEFRSSLEKQNYDKEPIWADLYYIDNGEAAGQSQMEYYDTLGDVRSFIRICIYASRSQYEDLLANIRSGLVLTRVDVKFAEGSQYWQSANPDQRYSRKIWKHEGYITEQFEPAVVPVEGHAFYYTILDDDKCVAGSVLR